MKDGRIGVAHLEDGIHYALSPPSLTIHPNFYNAFEQPAQSDGLHVLRHALVALESSDGALTAHRYDLATRSYSALSVEVSEGFAEWRPIRGLETAPYHAWVEEREVVHGTLRARIHVLDLDSLRWLREFEVALAVGGMSIDESIATPRNASGLAVRYFSTQNQRPVVSAIWFDPETILVQANALFVDGATHRGLEDTWATQLFAINVASRAAGMVEVFDDTAQGVEPLEYDWMRHDLLVPGPKGFPRIHRNDSDQPKGANHPYEANPGTVTHSPMGPYFTRMLQAKDTYVQCGSRVLEPAEPLYNLERDAPFRFELSRDQERAIWWFDTPEGIDHILVSDVRGILMPRRFDYFDDARWASRAELTGAPAAMGQKPLQAMGEALPPLHRIGAWPWERVRDFPEAAQLRMEAEPAKVAFAEGEEVSITLRLKNEGDSGLWLAPPAGANITGVLHSEAVSYTLGEACMPGDDVASAPVYLAPGEAIEQVCTVADHAPGVYTILAAYQCVRDDGRYARVDAPVATYAVEGSEGKVAELQARSLVAQYVAGEINEFEIMDRIAPLREAAFEPVREAILEMETHYDPNDPNYPMDLPHQLYGIMEGIRTKEAFAWNEARVLAGKMPASTPSLYWMISTLRFCRQQPDSCMPSVAEGAHRVVKNLLKSETPENRAVVYRTLRNYYVFAPAFLATARHDMHAPEADLRTSALIYLAGQKLEEKEAAAAARRLKYPCGRQSRFSQAWRETSPGKAAAEAERMRWETAKNGEPDYDLQRKIQEEKQQAIKARSAVLNTEGRHSRLGLYAAWLLAACAEGATEEAAIQTLRELDSLYSANQNDLLVNRTIERFLCEHADLVRSRCENFGQPGFAWLRDAAAHPTAARVAHLRRLIPKVQGHTQQHFGEIPDAPWWQIRTDPALNAEYRALLHSWADYLEENPVAIRIP
jgi:hypothetical protein